jgi:hypothetical protein
MVPTGFGMSPLLRPLGAASTPSIIYINLPCLPRPATHFLFSIFPPPIALAAVLPLSRIAVLSNDYPFLVKHLHFAPHYHYLSFPANGIANVVLSDLEIF